MVACQICNIPIDKDDWTAYEDCEAGMPVDKVAHTTCYLNWMQSRSVKPSCFHYWKKYIGFREVYRYCTKCDAKEFEK